MSELNSKKIRFFADFLNKLAKDMTKYYTQKLDKPFKAINKSKGKGYDPVTKADRAFEKFIRLRIKKKFPKHNIIGEEFGSKKTKSDFTWVIDPIDGTRSVIIGNPTWSNLFGLNFYVAYRTTFSFKSISNEKNSNIFNPFFHFIF